MSLKDQPVKLQPFLFHGVELTWGESADSEAEGVCPFCSKDNLHVNMKTGQYHCKSDHCGRSGNIYTFFSDYWSLCYEQGTSEEDLRTLTAERGIKKGTSLRKWKFVKSILTGEWLVPGFSSAGKMINLYRWSEIEGKFRMLSSPNCSPALLGVHLWNKEKKKAVIMEGIWDAISYWETMGMIRLSGNKYVQTNDSSVSCRASLNIVAVPGYRSFQDTWSDLFNTKTISLMFHSDHPKPHPQTGSMCDPAGLQGMQRTYQMLNGVKDVSIIDWGPKGFAEDRKDGYDIRDICTEYTPVQVPSQIKFTSVPESWKEDKVDFDAEDKFLTPTVCTSYRDLQMTWRKALRWTDELNVTLMVILAVVTSTRQRGDQLWCRIIGPPGVAKTRICEAICVARKYAYPLGVSKGFHSGWRGEDPDEDFSILAKANNMTLVTKEGDTLLSSPMLNEILSQGRDVYDGTSSSEWRNRKSNRIYTSLRMTWVIAGTKSLRRLNRSNLGDRFIDCVITRPDQQEEDDILNRAIRSAFRATKSISDGTAETQLEPRLIDAYRATGGYVNWLRETGPSLLEQLESQECPEDVLHQCKRLAQFVALMRARRDKEDEEIDSEAELPTRLGAQFTRLAMCLTIVMNKTKLDDDVMMIVLRIAIDTAYGTNLRIIQFLSQSKYGYDAATIALSLRISETTVRKTCRFLFTLGMVRPYRKPNTQGKGNHRGMWELSRNMRQLYTEIISFHGEQQSE